MLMISTVFNYLDPGSGSVVIQMIIGALIGVGVTLKLYWERLKQMFTSKFSKSNDV